MRDWIETAVRMQRRAELAALLGRRDEEFSYLRRRDYCARKAREQGKSVWGAVFTAGGEVEVTRKGTRS